MVWSNRYGDTAIVPNGREILCACAERPTSTERLGLTHGMVRHAPRAALNRQTYKTEIPSFMTNRDGAADSIATRIIFGS